jgi:transcriptional regulator with XRE-family HTH domain
MDIQELTDELTVLIGTFDGTQSQLSAITGVSQQHLSLLKTQNRSPNLKTMWAILDALGYTIKIVGKEDHLAHDSR